jgi:hypothetical protein
MAIPQVQLSNSFSDWVIITNQIANYVGDLNIFSGSNIGRTSLVSAINNLDTVKFNISGGTITGAVTLSSTLNVTSDTALGGLLSVTGNTSIGSNFSVTASNGNTSIGGTLSVTGGINSSTLSLGSNLTINTNKFIVAGASGNTTIAGTLNVAGAVTVGALSITSLTVTGILTASSDLNLAGNLNISTNKFNVTASNGNTSVGGTLTVYGPISALATYTASLGTVTTSTPFLTLSQTWNNSATTFSAILANINNTASGVNSLLLNFQLNGSTVFGVAASGTITQIVSSNSLARSILANVSELRTFREYQDLNDGLSVGTQGLDVNSSTAFGTTYNAKWDSTTLTYIKDRQLAADHSNLTRMTEDYKHQWMFSNGTVVNSPIAWAKKVEFDLFNSTYTFNGSMTVGTVNTSNLVTTGSVTLGTSTTFADYNVTTTAISTTVLATIVTTTYRSAIFQIQAYDATSGKYHLVNISAIHNGTVVDSVEYGAVAVAGVCGTFTVTLSGTSLFLNVTPASANSTVFKVHTTLINI